MSSLQWYAELGQWEQWESEHCHVIGCDKLIWARGVCNTHYRRLWVAENRERNNANQRAYLKKWRQESEKPENVSARGERYRKRNLARFADKERIRRATKRSNGGKFSRLDWMKLLNRFGHKCAYCLTEQATTIDHVIPLKQGGSNFIGNILPACFSCNSSKQDRLLIEWRNRNG